MLTREKIKLRYGGSEPLMSLLDNAGHNKTRAINVLMNLYLQGSWSDGTRKINTRDVVDGGPQIILKQKNAGGRTLRDIAFALERIGAIKNARVWMAGKGDVELINKNERGGNKMKKKAMLS